MSSRTKIVVLRMKEIIYTAIFIGLALLLIILFFFMLRTRKADYSQTTPSVSFCIRIVRKPARQCGSYRRL